MLEMNMTVAIYNLKAELAANITRGARINGQTLVFDDTVILPLYSVCTCVLNNSLVM